MVNSNQLLCLYTRVLEDTSFVNGVSEKDVKQAIEHMHKVYQGSPDSLSKSFDSFTDFNEVAYRCAYLFKYAPFHTALAYKAMSHALTESPYELQKLLDSLSGPFKLCSLGGGPGADVIGVLAALHDQFGFFRSSIKLVDIMSEWELTFWSVLDELRHQNYGTLSESMSAKWFDWSFMTADLQSKMSRELTQVLESADLVTMIKFVSAAASKETSNMIEKIFRIVKPGAFILFVDNAAGGFKELISKAAKKYKFNAIATPLKHQPYTNECFKNIKYGFKSCYESKVAVQLLMKSFPINLNEDNLRANWSSNKNVHTSLASHWKKIVPQFQNFRIGPKPVNHPMNDFETFHSPANYSNEDNMITNWSFNENIPASPVAQWQKIHVPQFLSRNFRIGPKPVDNPKNDFEIFDSPTNYSNEGNVITNCSFNENIPASPAVQWQKIHVPQFRNFRISPKPVDNLINDCKTYETPSNCHGSNFLLSSEFTPRLKQIQIGSPMNLNESFESQPFRSSTPHASVGKNWSLTKTIPDSGYSDESFESKLLWGSPEYDSSPHFKASHILDKCRFPKRRIGPSIPDIVSYSSDENSLAPIPYRQNMQQLEQRQLESESPLHQPLRSSTPHALSSQNWPLIKTSHDSGYSDESFESKLLWGSPEYNSSPHFRASHRIGKCRIPERRIEIESYWNPPKKLSYHSGQMHNDENSSPSVPYRQNMHQLEQKPLNSELHSHQPWNRNCHPFGILQHSERYEPERSRTRHLKNGLFSLPPSHPCPTMYKAPRSRKVLLHQCKPYERKRSQTK